MKVLNNKILILGGNPETVEVVIQANSMNLETYVVDMNPKSHTKKHAFKKIDIDATDTKKIVQLIKKEQIGSVIVGVADILVKPYFQVCKELNMPCYATKEAIKYLCSKVGFEQFCKKYSLPTIPSYGVYSDIKEIDQRHINFPVMIKPVDSGGGVGMRICRNAMELKNEFNFSVSKSKSKKCQVEKLMSCEDIFVYYNFVDGLPIEMAVADRYTSKKTKYASPVCIGAVYPSKHTKKFESSHSSKFKDALKNLSIKFGVLNIQFFVEENSFFAYDPGFRLQGEAPHVYLKEIANINNVKSMIEFSQGLQTNKVSEYGKFISNFTYKKCCTLWILITEGKINKIEGLDTIADNNFVVGITQRFEEGDVVTKDMIGTEKQVFAKIYIVEDSWTNLKDAIKKIKDIIKISDMQKESMIYDWFNEQDLDYYINNDV